jgi:DNA (cytosine-5)-methyltransferase 1
MFFFTKAKRAQNVNDYESWNEGGVAPTLNAMDNNGEAYATVLIIDGTRVNDVRVYEDGIVPTVISRYGTGGGNVPMIFSHTQGLDAQPSEENSPTLRTGGNGMAVVYPIDDARELEKHQNGTGIGAEGAPAYTLDRQQAPAIVAFSPSDFANYSEGMGTLRAGMTNNNSPLAVDIYNHSVSEINQTLRKGSGGPDHTGAVMTPSVVRRLTPVECERLQGFPDNWTDGQADSNRYKQMGNAVAVPVVQWIINRMVAQIGE